MNLGRGWNPLLWGSTSGIWLEVGVCDLILASGWVGEGGLGYELKVTVGAHSSGI